MPSLRPQPSAFSNPAGAANMVSGVVMTVASHHRVSACFVFNGGGGACESRSRGTYKHGVSTPGSIHDGMPVSIVGLVSCPLTSHHSSNLSKPATSDLPSFNSTQAIPTVLLYDYQLPTLSMMPMAEPC